MEQRWGAPPIHLWAWRYDVSRGNEVSSWRSWWFGEEIHWQARTTTSSWHFRKTESKPVPWQPLPAEFHNGFESWSTDWICVPLVILRAYTAKFADLLAKYAKCPPASRIENKLTMYISKTFQCITMCIQSPSRPRENCHHRWTPLIWTSLMEMRSCLNMSSPLWHQVTWVIFGKMWLG